MSDELRYEKHTYNAGDILEANHMNRIETYLEDIYGILYAQPEIHISYPNNTTYTSLNSIGVLDFDITARGAVLVTVTEGNTYYYNGWTDLRHLHIPVGVINDLVPKTYTITITDKYDNKAEAKITNIIINANVTFNYNGISQSAIENFIIGYDNTTHSANLVSKLDNSFIQFELHGYDVPVANSTKILYSLDGITYNDYWQATDEENGLTLYTIPFNSDLIITNLVNEVNSGTVYFKAQFALGEATNTIPTSAIPLSYLAIPEGETVVLINNDITTFRSNEHFYIDYRLLSDTCADGGVLGDLRITAVNTAVAGGGVNPTRNQYNVLNNRDYITNFNLLDEGVYTFTFYLNNGTSESIILEQTNIIVARGADYTEGAIFELNALNYSPETDMETWPNKGSLENSDLSMYGKYTYKNATTIAPACVNFNVNTVGVLSKETSQQIQNQIDAGQGFAFEFYYKAYNTGEYSAPVFTAASEFSETGYTFTVFGNRIKVLSTYGPALTAYLSEEEWNHVVITSCPANEKGGEIANYNRENTLRVYVNGCIVGCSSYAGQLSWKGFYTENAPQFSFNGFVKDENYAQPSHSGSIDLANMRIYPFGLSSTEIMTNYKNCIQHNTDRYNAFVEREKEYGIAHVFFIKNNPAESYTNDEDIIDASGYMDFDSLHAIWKKQYDEEDEDMATYTEGFSKTSAVNCTMYIVQRASDGEGIGRFQQINNVDVKLQGTSSLLYPSKNYQIKNYELNNKTSDNELSFLPNVKEVPANGAGWNGSEGDFVYTLKCDFMEQSHRNNTPTAEYYDEVLEDVIAELHQVADGENYDKNNYLSPAKVKSTNYRDSITGFPAIVYYSNNASQQPRLDLSETGVDDVSITNLLANLQNISTSVGSYMFNLDKEGKALGFELETQSTEKTLTYYPIEDQYVESYSVESGVFTFTLDRNIHVISNVMEENELGQQEIKQKLVSIYDLDGLAAQAPNEFKFHLFAYNDKLHNKNTFEIIDCGEFTLSNLNDKVAIGSLTNTEMLSGFTHAEADKQLIPLCLSQVWSYDTPNSGICVSLEGTTNSSDWAAANFYTVNESNSHHGTKRDKYNYYKKTLDPRYSSFKKVRKSNFYLGAACEYDKLDRIIKFFYIVKRLREANRFYAKEAIEWFETLFSKEYVLTYYLQMLAFTQVDNSGKNAMFDFWDNGKVYPRPYDMDTQMGFDNTGHDIVPTSSELNDATRTGGLEEFGVKFTYCDSTDKELNINLKRAQSYNTLNSRLWSFVWEQYYNDLKKIYNNFRRPDNTYDVDIICSAIDAKTCDIISEQQYNRDAVLKYLGQNSNSYYYVVAGNRKNRYKQFLSERLLFLDSVFEINNYGVDSNKLVYRATVGGEVELGLDVTHPTYITMKAGQNSTTEEKFFVDPSMTWVEGEGDEAVVHSGVLIKYRNIVSGGSGQETVIVPANVLKTITGLGNMEPVYLDGINALTNLQKFEMTRAGAAISDIEFKAHPKLVELTLANMPGLSSVNVTYTPNLKVLNLRGCSALGTLTLDTDIENAYTKPLSYLNLQDCTSLSRLSLINCTNLQTANLILDNCSNLSELYIDNCPWLTALDFEKLTQLAKLTIKNCDNLTSFTCKNHDKLTSLTISNCQNLANIDLEDSKLVDLDLSIDLPNLDQVILKNSENLETLKLMEKSGQAYMTKLDVQYCVALKTINSNITGVYDLTNIPIGYYDARDSTKCVSGYARFAGNNDVRNTILTDVVGLNYYGSGKNMFYGANKLVNVTGNLVFRDSMENCFSRCASFKKLTETPTSELHMDPNHKVTSLSGTFLDAQGLTTAVKNRIMDQFVKGNNSLTTIYNLFRGCSSNEWEIPSGFTMPSGLESIYAAFYTSNLTTLNSNTSLFSSCTSLGNVDGVFANNPSLSTIPSGLFVNCPVTSARWFAASSGITSLPNNLFSTTNGKTINGEYLFASCSSLNSNLSNFMKNNTTFTNLNYAFSKTAFSSLPNGVLSSNCQKSLTSAVGMFSGCKQLTSLPNYLVRSDEDTQAKLTGSINSNTNYRIVLSGLFAGCENLKGTIPASLFNGIKPNITHLGVTTTRAGFETGTATKIILGAFANTAVENYEIRTAGPEDNQYKYTAFSQMPNLTDISCLFAQATVPDGTKNANSKLEFRLERSTSSNRHKFIGYSGSSGQSLSYHLFQDSPNITVIRGAFMGTGIKDLQYDLVDDLVDGKDEDEDGIVNYTIQNQFSFGAAPNNLIKDASLIFADTPLQNSAVTLSADLNTGEELTKTDSLVELFKTLPKVEKMNYTFAGSSISNIDCIKPLKLIEASGICASCENISNLPKDLFEKSRSTLTKLDYAFAKTSIETVTESIESYDINDVNFDIYDKSHTLLGTIVVDRTDPDVTVFKYNDKIITKIEEDADNQLVITAGSISKLAYSDIWVNLTIPDLSKEQEYYTFEGGKFLSPDLIFPLGDVLATNIEVIGEVWRFKLYEQVQKNFTANIFYNYLTITPSVNSGLLYNCHALLTVEGMFAGSALTTLPGALFKTSYSGQYSSLTNLSNLFADCAVCEGCDEATSGKIVPSNWLSKCPNVSNINGIMMRLGNAIEADGGTERNQYELGSAFDDLRSLQYANYAFAHIGELKNTKLDSNFLYKAIASKRLANCNYLFACTPIAQFSGALEPNSGRNAIANFNYAFSYSFDFSSDKISNYALTKRTSMPTSCSFTKCWIGDTECPLAHATTYGWKSTTYNQTCTHSSGQGAAVLKPSIIEAVQDYYNTFAPKTIVSGWIYTQP